MNTNKLAKVRSSSTSAQVCFDNTAFSYFTALVFNWYPVVYVSKH